MIPIRDTIHAKQYPVVNMAIIGLNVLIFLWQPSNGPAQERFFYLYGLVPARYTVPGIGAYFTFGEQVFSFISFMFLHGGFLHILGNMWFLYIFGENVESRLGPYRYLIFYLVCGVASGIAHFMFNPGANAPIIGASGAIAGVMGAYILLYPRARILTLIPIFIFPWFIEIPAYFFLGFWFVIQFINATGSSADSSGIAWWAHVGGFLTGMLLLRLLLKLPSSGLSDPIRRVTERKKSSRLQLVRPSQAGQDPHLHGTLRITPYEALAGTQKLINISLGFHKQLFRVTIPEGTQDGTVLRMKGLGKPVPGGTRGDVYLRVRVEMQLPDR
jgi:hypothetical protein